MWERSSQIWEWRKVCVPCKKLGQRRHKADSPVCLETGGACAKEAKLPPLPDVPLTRRAANALKLFYGSSTQWRTSMGGAIGLDYPACRMVADNLGIPWDETFPLLRVVEGARLAYVNEQEEAKRDEDEKKRRLPQGR